jgi:hypothetical protein
MLEHHASTTSSTLRAFAKRLSLQNDPGLVIKAKSPGSLGSVLNLNDDKFQVGSVSIAVPSPKLSLLLFANGKLKISGGCHLQEQDQVRNISKTQFEEFLWTRKIEGVCTSLSLPVHARVNVCLINGSVLLRGVTPENYYNLCVKLQRCGRYHRVVMPTVFSCTNVRKRGRICAVKVYVCADSKASIHFDHSGKGQLFAFKDTRDMQAEYEKLQALILE